MAVMNMVNGGVASSPNLLLWLPSSHFCSIPLAVGKPHALDVAEIKNKSLDICSFFLQPKSFDQFSYICHMLRLGAGMPTKSLGGRRSFLAGQDCLA